MAGIGEMVRANSGQYSKAHHSRHHCPYSDTVTPRGPQMAIAILREFLWYLVATQGGLMGGPSNLTSTAALCLPEESRMPNGHSLPRQAV